VALGILLAAPTHAQQFCDTQILGVRLYDGDSFRQFQEKHGRGAVRQEFGLRQVLYYNSTGDEALTFFVHPGAPIDDVGEIRIQKRSAKERSRGNRTVEPHLATSRGVALGMTQAALESALGRPAAVTVENGRTIVRYHCKEGVDCECATRVGMPEYEASYAFEADKLVDAKFGFPYP
jgi:hypothetical protein